MISERKKNFINSFLALTEGETDLSGDGLPKSYYRSLVKTLPSQRPARPQRRRASLMDHRDLQGSGYKLQRQWNGAHQRLREHPPTKLLQKSKRVQFASISIG